MSTGDLALDLSLSQTHLIEASAGTGKTYAIAGLYLRCIVERRLPVREILVVTFTRAATEELKDRLRARLAQCADLAETQLRDPARASPNEPSSEAAFAMALIERATAEGESLESLARRLRLEAVSMDEAAIHTIHGFCQRILREQAFASGEAFDAGDLVGSDRDLIEQIAADFWRLTASDPLCAADFDVLAVKVGSAPALAGLLYRLVDPDLVVWPRATATDAKAQLEAALAIEERARRDLMTAWCSDGERTLALVEEHMHAKRLDGRSYRLDWHRGRAQACTRAFLTGEAPAALDKLAWFGVRKLAAAAKQELPDLHNAFTNAVDAWLDAQQAVQLAQSLRWPVLLDEARTHAHAQLQLRKQRAVRQSYDDLIRRLHSALTDPAEGERLARALHARFPVILVDEFQDTDERQFAIFQRMHVAHPGGALILVGDPKQAIYRFRGGDIEAYLRAADSAGERHSLLRNFRSSPALLRAIEAVFTQDESHAAFVDPRIRFLSVKPGDRVADDDVLVDAVPVTPLTAWTLRDGVDSPNKDDGRSALAVGCAQTIVELLRKSRAGSATVRNRITRLPVPLAPRDLAILVTTNAEATLMQDALTARGVASAMIRQESVFATGEARDLHAFLAALDSQEDASLRAALASRLFGFDATTLAVLADPAQAQAWQMQLQRLDALRRLWQQQGVLAMCERVFESRAASILDEVAGERRMTNYLQLADLLQRESVRQFGAAGLIEWLHRRIAQADDRNEEEQVRLESDADCVQIATIHASKGLEYNLVFLPFTALAPGQPGGSPTTFEWHAEDQRNLWVRAAGDEKTDELDSAQAIAERESLAERVRVLYVALTRARYACWFSWDVIGSKGLTPALAQLWHGGEMPKASETTRAALERLRQSVPAGMHVTALPEADPVAVDPPSIEPLPPARRFDSRIDTTWWISSFSQLRDGQRSALDDANGVDDERTETADVSGGPNADAGIADWPRGDRFGTAMHEILERTDFAAWRGHAGVVLPAGERDAIVARLHRHALAPAERDAELQRVVARMLGATLNVRLPGDVRLADLATADRRAELPFHFAIGGADPERLIALLRSYGYQQRRTDFARAQHRLAGLMTGVIDLVYRHEGRWWLIDYKTNHLGSRRADYAPQALDAAVRDSDYDLQYLIYTLALHRWLRARLGDAYDYERDVGGAVYLFLRGLSPDGSSGVHVDRPDVALIEAMDALLAAETTT